MYRYNCNVLLLQFNGLSSEKHVSRSWFLQVETTQKKLQYHDLLDGNNIIFANFKNVHTLCEGTKINSIFSHTMVLTTIFSSVRSASPAPPSPSHPPQPFSDSVDSRSSCAVAAKTLSIYKRGSAHWVARVFAYLQPFAHLIQRILARN